ncbi:MAG: hypothetical protein GY714_09210 [Desulfobacterales bacterium]|nr:hypothetical protein [Desulfobacterales bacterium]
MEPMAQVGFKRNLCKKCINICESFFFKYFIRPVFFILPSFTTTIVAKKGLKDEVINYVGQPIGDFLNESAILIILGTFLYVILLRAIYAGIENYANSDKVLEFKHLITLIEAFDIIVGDKTNRMCKQAKKAIASSSVCGETTFNKITKPDQQIALLIAGLRRMFLSIDKTEAEFRVGLISVVNDKPDQWFAFDPISLPPRTEAKDLGAVSSTVSNSIKNRSIIVVEDIQKEMIKKERYIKGNTQKFENGSQLCYPIIHMSTGNIEYVISIAGNRSRCLKEKHIELYKWIIKQFAMRISMEHSLLIMKEKSNEYKLSA